MSDKEEEIVAITQVELAFTVKELAEIILNMDSEHRARLYELLAVNKNA